MTDHWLPVALAAALGTLAGVAVGIPAGATLLAVFSKPHPDYPDVEEPDPVPEGFQELEECESASDKVREVMQRGLTDEEGVYECVYCSERIEDPGQHHRNEHGQLPPPRGAYGGKW